MAIGAHLDPSPSHGACVVLAAACLVLSGCGETNTAPAPPRPTTTSAATPAPTEPPTTAAATSAPAPESLVGEYRVAGIDGAPLDADFGIALSVGPARISFEPTCAGFVWDYTYRDGALRTARAPGYGPTRQPDGSVVVCTVAVPPELRRLGQAIDAATRAARTPANGIELSGGGHAVTLFSQ